MGSVRGMVRYVLGDDTQLVDIEDRYTWCLFSRKYMSCSLYYEEWEMNKQKTFVGMSDDSVMFHGFYLYCSLFEC